MMHSESALVRAGHFGLIQPVLPGGPCPLRPEIGVDAWSGRVQIVSRSVIAPCDSSFKTLGTSNHALMNLPTMNGLAKSQAKSCGQ